MARTGSGTRQGQCSIGARRGHGLLLVSMASERDDVPGVARGSDVRVDMSSLIALKRGCVAPRGGLSFVCLRRVSRARKWTERGAETHARVRRMAGDRSFLPRLEGECTLAILSQSLVVAWYQVCDALASVAGYGCTAAGRGPCLHGTAVSVSMSCAWRGGCFKKVLRCITTKKRNLIHYKFTFPQSHQLSEFASSRVCSSPTEVARG